MFTHLRDDVQPYLHMNLFNVCRYRRHAGVSKALKYHPVCKPGFTKKQKNEYLDTADTGDYMQGLIQMLRNPHVPFLADQKACENLALAAASLLSSSPVHQSGSERQS